MNIQTEFYKKILKNTALCGFLSMTFWSVSFIVSAQPIELTSQTPARFDITAQIGIYEDKTSQLSFEKEIKKKAFYTIPKTGIIHSFLYPYLLV